MFSVAVTDGGEFHGCLRVGAESDVQRGVGFFEAEGAFELSHFDAEAVKLLPFDEGIDDARSFVLTGCSVDFKLEFIVEVLIDFSIDIEAEEAEVEAAVFFRVVFVAPVELSDDVASELHGRFHVSKDFGRLGRYGVAGCEDGDAGCFGFVARGVLVAVVFSVGRGSEEEEGQEEIFFHCHFFVTF